MKIGMKFKAIEGLSKGKTFTIIKVTDKKVSYRSDETGITYDVDRKHFEKYIERVNKHWSETNKAYKKRKNEMKGE